MHVWPSFFSTPEIFNMHSQEIKNSPDILSIHGNFTISPNFSIFVCEVCESEVFRQCSSINQCIHSFSVEKAQFI